MCGRSYLPSGRKILLLIALRSFNSEKSVELPVETEWCKSVELVGVWLEASNSNEEGPTEEVVSKSKELTEGRYISVGNIVG